MNLTKFYKIYMRKTTKLMKEIKDLNKWRDIPCSWVGRLDIVEMLVIPNIICRFNTIPMKIPEVYFVDTNKLVLKFIWKGKSSRITNSTL